MESSLCARRRPIFPSTRKLKSDGHDCTVSFVSERNRVPLFFKEFTCPQVILISDRQVTTGHAFWKRRAGGYFGLTRSRRRVFVPSSLRRFRLPSLLPATTLTRPSSSVDSRDRRRRGTRERSHLFWARDGFESRRLLSAGSVRAFGGIGCCFYLHIRYQSV